MSKERTYTLLERIANLLRSEERSAGQEHGLQPVHVHAISYLARCNRYSDTPIAVADYLGVTKGTASQTLKRLEEKELLEAFADEADGRVVHYALTDAGRAVAQQILPPASLRPALRAADADTEACLEALLTAMQRAHGAKPFGVCRTCQHFVENGRRYQCGLTGEPLSAADAKKICREQSLA